MVCPLLLPVLLLLSLRPTATHASLFSDPFKRVSVYIPKDVSDRPQKWVSGGLATICVRFNNPISPFRPEYANFFVSMKAVGHLGLSLPVQVVAMKNANNLRIGYEKLMQAGPKLAVVQHVLEQVANDAEAAKRIENKVIRLINQDPEEFTHQKQGHECAKHFQLPHIKAQSPRSSYVTLVRFRLPENSSRHPKRYRIIIRHRHLIFRLFHMYRPLGRIRFAQTEDNHGQEQANFIVYPANTPAWKKRWYKIVDWFKKVFRWRRKKTSEQSNVFETEGGPGSGPDDPGADPEDPEVSEAERRSQEEIQRS